MKTLKENKGFTLIELLAVIVVLAIVMVLATTTILPYTTKSSRNAFAIEANAAISASSDVLSLMTINQIQKPATGVDFTMETTGEPGNQTTTYCFSLKQLVDFGILKMDINDVSGANAKYAGRVKVITTDSSKAYTYQVKMHNDNLYVDKAGGTIKTDGNDIKDFDKNNAGSLGSWGCGS